jgi:hypothetical protein
MSEQKIEKQETPEQLSDILLVLDSDRKKIQAVSGIDKDGNLATVDPWNCHLWQDKKVKP